MKNALLEKYPKIFANCRYLAVGDGWVTLIDTLCEHLQYNTDHNEHPQVVVMQVKEKFGGLRFYTEGVNDYQSGMIAFAEDISKTICDQCGNAGKRVTRRSFIMTRCPFHGDL